jgi:hypothetical protein
LGCEHDSRQGAHSVHENVASLVVNNYLEQRFRNIAEEVMNIVTLSLTHQIDEVKPIDSPNAGQNELVRTDLPVDF